MTLESKFQEYRKMWAAMEAERDRPGIISKIALLEDEIDVLQNALRDIEQPYRAQLQHIAVAIVPEVLAIGQTVEMAGVRAKYAAARHTPRVTMQII